MVGSDWGHTPEPHAAPERRPERRMERRRTPGGAPRGRRGGPRLLLVFFASLVLVIGISVVVGLVAGGDPTAPESADDANRIVAVLPALDAGTGAAVGDVLEIGVSSAEREQPDTADWEALLPRLQELEAANPDDRNIQRKLAIAYYNLGELDTALTIYERLLADEEDPVLRSRLGNTLRDMGDTAGAEDAYRQALDEDPTLPATYINLAELLWRAGEDDEALAVVEQGLAAVPEDRTEGLQAARDVLTDVLTGD